MVVTHREPVPALIAEEFGSLGAEMVLIFGSWAARHCGEDGPPPNDIDVLVIGEVACPGLLKTAAKRATARLGTEVNPLVRSRERWTHPDDWLTAWIKASPYVVIHGARVQAAA